MNTRIDADRRRGFRLLGCGLLGLALAAGVAHAQPFGAWMVLTGDPTNGWVNVSNSSAFNITGPFTVEAWVAISNSASGEDCRSIIGKRFQETWWLGQCNVLGQPTLRSYLKGTSPSNSARNGGIIPRGVWTHVAVVFTGTQRLHYINGELAAQFAETGPLPTNTQPIQIGSDPGWVHSPAGAIDEVRLWNVARTTEQIRAWINRRITAPQTGLVSVWPFDASTTDIIGGHNGTVAGSGVGALSFPPGGTCTTTANQLCLQGRFIITTKWRTNPVPGTPPDGSGAVAFTGPNSGVFWFFSSDNWEIMVKALNACFPPFNRYWIYSAGLTDVFFRMEVFDKTGLQNKIYFNYPGAPAPAITDSDAFATCP